MVGLAEAQTSASFNLTWNVIGGGGGSSGSTGYKLNGTTGQSAIGFSTGTSYKMGSGYLYGIVQSATGNNPVAILGADKLQCENVGAKVQFNGTASYDPDGIISSYYWEFGDGATGTDATLNHTYAAYKWNGTAYQPYRVNLTVKDVNSLTNSTSQNVIIWMTGDANGDGKVNILDASVVGLKWNGYDSCADLNNDVKVNILDSSIIGLNWGKLGIIGG